MAPYRHKQNARLMLVWMAIAGLGVLLGLVILLATGSAPIGAVAALSATLALVVVAGWWFSSMTVYVDDNEVRWRFGLGRTFRIARSEIEGVQVVRHPWWGGYGIRYAGLNRRTYIIGGRQTVEVRLKQGGWRRLGTDDPQGVLAALNPGRR